MAAPVQTSLSMTSRWLTRVIAVAYLGAIGLVIIIVIATLLNIGIFHFSAHPRHIVYLATYLVVMTGTVGILWWNQRENRPCRRPAGLPAPVMTRVSRPGQA